MENHREPRDEHVLHLTTHEASALEKRLRAERTLKQDSSERVRCICFGRASPRPLDVDVDVDAQEHELQVRAWERSRAPDEVVLQIRRVFADELRQVRLHLPRRAFRPAVRANALQELSPGLPRDLVPMLGIEMSRRTWSHPDGWWVALDRNLALHRLNPRVLERTGRVLLGIPDKIIDGSVAMTVGGSEGTLPDWLELLAGASMPWDLFHEGLALTAPRPSAASVAPGLRLVLQ